MWQLLIFLLRNCIHDFTLPAIRVKNSSFDTCTNVLKHLVNTYIFSAGK